LFEEARYFVYADASSRTFSPFASVTSGNGRSALRNTDCTVLPASPRELIFAKIFSSDGVSVCGAARRMSSKYIRYWPSRGSCARNSSILARPMARISGRMNEAVDWNCE
jgi:hypothetical protein